MNLAVFVSDYKRLPDNFDRLKADKLGIILVQDGVNYAAVKENGKVADILSKGTECYALTEDLQTRGFTDADVDGKVKIIDYSALVDLIFNDYEKLAWI
ncbi:MAG: sulfurtransferase complex subunit TusB [Thermodesulfovibrionales bacterium]